MLCESGSPLPRLNRRFVDCDATGRLRLSQHFYRRLGLSGDSELSDQVRRDLAPACSRRALKSFGTLWSIFAVSTTFRACASVADSFRT